MCYIMWKQVFSERWKVEYVKVFGEQFQIEYFDTKTGKIANVNCCVCAAFLKDRRLV